MIKTNPLSVKMIEDIAIEYRKLFCKDNEPFEVLKVLDLLFEKNELSYQILEDENLFFSDNVVALYNASENFIYVRESVITEYESGNYRSSFTLCHELFHYIQAQILQFNFEIVDECKPYEEVDWQANEFAGQILIPTKYLHLEENEIVERFKVSLECVLTRKAKSKKRKEKKTHNES